MVSVNSVNLFIRLKILKSCLAKRPSIQTGEVLLIKIVFFCRLRLMAESKGFRLDDTGLFPIRHDAHGQKVPNFFPYICTWFCITSLHVYSMLCVTN